MKKLGFTILAAAALTLPLSAQSPEIMHADIPFAFVVGNTTSPAGAYFLSSEVGKSWVVMGLVGTTGRFVSTNLDRDSTSRQEAKLVFHRYGNQYFLSQIATTSRSRDISPSRLEGEAKKTTVAAGWQMQTEIVLATR